MKAEGHRQAAEQIEKGIAKLQPDTDPDMARLAIEGAWGASFQWIAFGCETKYQQHQNNHTRLGRFLRTLGEETVALWWEGVDACRQGGWYGGGPDPADLHDALEFLQNIRAWATQ
jgi:hypothetical protein